MLTFVPASEQDAACIADLRRRVWSETYRGIYPDVMLDDFDMQWHIAQEKKRIDHPQYHVFLLVLNDIPAGYLTLRMGAEALLMSLYLLKSCHGHGHGRQAMEFVAKLFSQAGYSYFVLQCQPDNRPARAFYEHLGGIVIGRETGDDRWQDTVIYRFMV